MNDILLNLISLTGFLIVGGVIFLILRRKQKQQQQLLANMAFQKGWHIQFIKENLAKGFRLETSQWTLESISKSSGVESGPGSSNIEQTTKWSTPLSGSALLIGPKYSQAPIDPSMTLFIKQTIFANIGDEASQMQEVPIGSSSFRKQFMVWANDPHEAESMLTPSVQSALLTWTKVPPLIKRTSSGLSIELKGIALKKPAEIDSLVKLGERFL